MPFFEAFEFTLGVLVAIALICGAFQIHITFDSEDDEDDNNNNGPAAFA